MEHVTPTATGWLAADDIGAMDHRRYAPARTARRFESGAPSIPSVYAGIAGIELTLDIGIEATRAHVLALHDRLLEGLDELGATVITPREPDARGAPVCVRSSDASARVTALGTDGVVTSERDSCLRISPHCYHALDDIDALVVALSRQRSLLSSGAREAHAPAVVTS